jgi:hypothetical protein
MVESREFPAPIDDCESFAWCVKESVSSSAARSGDVEVEDAEGASLENRVGCRERAMVGWVEVGCVLFQLSVSSTYLNLASDEGPVDMEKRCYSVYVTQELHRRSFSLL